MCTYIKQLIVTENGLEQCSIGLQPLRKISVEGQVLAVRLYQRVVYAQGIGVEAAPRNEKVPGTISSVSVHVFESVH
jgi:hypothetical protein